MRRIVLITTMAFIAGLFTVSQGLGAGEHGQDKVSEDVGMDQGTTGMDQSVAGVQMDSNQIIEMQKLLQEKGYDPGATDGVINQQTQEALRSFQEAQNLTATGEPTEETLRALAPDVETQELLGLSPEFGQDQMQQDQMQEPVQEPVQEPMQEPVQEPIQEPIQQEQP